MSTQPFGKYQLLRKLATGGMAEVWLALQTGIEDFQRNVVVKRILPHLAEDAEFVQMFLNEAKIAARFAHANIAQIYDLGRENGSYFIAMEYVHGEDLGRIMRKAWSAGQWLTKPLAIRIIAEACEGLYYAHTRSDEATGKPLRVVHRDVSPQNILVSFEGSVKLVDFGIAKAADQASLTRSGAIKGKFAYMSPEQASGKALDHRSDIFALGLVLYELLTGVRPIKRENDLATLQAALECAIDPPSTVSDVPPELDPVVMRALAKLPDDRYRDARQFQLALEEVLATQRWVATSIQISELMHTLFADRIIEEAQAEAAEKPAPAESSFRHGLSGESAVPTERDVASELEWDAPPGPAPKEQGKSLERTSISRPELAAVGPKGKVEDWEAPPGERYVPGHRRRFGERAAAGLRTLGPRQGSGEVDMTSMSQGGAVVLARKTTRPSPEDEDPDVTSPRPETPKPMPAARKPTPDGIAPRKPAQPSHNGISRKPADMARADARALEKQPLPPPVRVEKVNQDEFQGPLEDVINVEAIRARSRQRFQVILWITVTIAVVLLAALFRQPILDALTSTAQERQGVQLTVTSNEPVSVFVRHPELGPDAALTPLGLAPVHEKGGAHLQDVVILENKARGIHYEEELSYGQPGQIKTINKEFQKGYFRPVIQPKNISGLAFYRGADEIGKYVPPGNPIEMVEGEYDLVLKGPKLQPGIPVHVKVIPNTKTDTAPIDLRGKL